MASPKSKGVYGTSCTFDSAGYGVVVRQRNFIVRRRRKLDLLLLSMPPAIHEEELTVRVILPEARAS